MNTKYHEIPKLSKAHEVIFLVFSTLNKLDCLAHKFFLFFFLFNKFVDKIPISKLFHHFCIISSACASFGIVGMLFIRSLTWQQSV